MRNKMFGIMVVGLVTVLRIQVLGQVTQEPSEPVSNPTRIQLDPCKIDAERPLSAKSLFSRRVDIVRRGKLRLDGKSIWFFLPEASSYTIKNPKSSSDSFENESSYFYVNQKKDKRLTLNEAWFCDGPFRVGDRMFSVVAIHPKGEWLDIAPSKTPLAGMVIGRKAPPFRWKTMAGEVVTNANFAGKYLVIDIWSPT